MMAYSVRAVTQVCTENAEENTQGNSSARNASRTPVLRPQCPQDSDGKEERNGQDYGTGENNATI